MSLALLAACGLPAGQDLSLDAPSGLVLWFENETNSVQMNGHKRVFFVMDRGRPFVDVFAVSVGGERCADGHGGAQGETLTREFRVPCVELLGVAPLGQDHHALADFRDELAHAQSTRSLH